MKYIVEDSSLIAVADAIRAKTGKSDPLTLAQMPTEIESIEGGGEDVFKFPTGEAGFYRHDTNFTDLLCTWDEYIENGVDIDGQHYEGGIYNSNGSSADSGYLLFGVPADVIIPQGYKYDLMSIECGNIVIPADAKSVSVMSYNYMHPDSNVGLTTLYIKDTTPDYFSLYESEVSPITKIVVPMGCANAYKSATGWCDYAEIMVEGTVIGGDNSVVGKPLVVKMIEYDPITELTATDLQGLTKIPAQSFGLGGILGLWVDASTNVCYWEIIQKITLPETVTEIESNGIMYVPSLNSLTVLAETPPTLGGEINGACGGYTYPIYVPAASVELYKMATNWSNYDIRAIA